MLRFPLAFAWQRLIDETGFVGSDHGNMKFDAIFDEPLILMEF